MMSSLIRDRKEDPDTEREKAMWRQGQKQEWGIYKAKNTKDYLQPPDPEVVQLLSCVRLFVTPRTTARQVSLSFLISWSFLKLRSIESVMSSNYFFLCCPLLLLPSIFPSIRVFSNESVLCIRWPKYWSFSISPSNEYSGLISFRIDWFGLLIVQGTLKCLPWPSWY